MLHSQRPHRNRREGNKRSVPNKVAASSSSGNRATGVAALARHSNSNRATNPNSRVSSNNGRNKAVASNSRDSVHNRTIPALSNRTDPDQRGNNVRKVNPNRRAVTGSPGRQDLRASHPDHPLLRPNRTKP